MRRHSPPVLRSVLVYGILIPFAVSLFPAPLASQVIPMPAPVPVLIPVLPPVTPQILNVHPQPAIESRRPNNIQRPNTEETIQPAQEEVARATVTENSPTTITWEFIDELSAKLAQDPNVSLVQRV